MSVWCELHDFKARKVKHSDLRSLVERGLFNLSFNFKSLKIV